MRSCIEREPSCIRERRKARAAGGGETVRGGWAGSESARDRCALSRCRFPGGLHMAYGAWGRSLQCFLKASWVGAHVAGRKPPQKIHFCRRGDEGRVFSRSALFRPSRPRAPHSVDPDECGAPGLVSPELIVRPRTLSPRPCQRASVRRASTRTDGHLMMSCGRERRAAANERLHHSGDIHPPLSTQTAASCAQRCPTYHPVHVRFMLCASCADVMDKRYRGGTTKLVCWWPLNMMW